MDANDGRYLALKRAILTILLVTGCVTCLLLILPSGM